MTTLYHSYSYTPYENAPIEPYSYPRGKAITRELADTLRGNRTLWNSRNIPLWR